MKYIRTEDGIKKVFKVLKDGFLLVKEGRRYNHYFPECKQANTIEELCDGFIGIPDKEWFEKNRVASKCICYFQKPFELEYGIWEKDFANLKLKNQNGWEYTAIEWLNKHHHFIFGYIEMDKGLIYVAKMNDKGELELL